MATAYYFLQVDLDLPEKPEVQLLIDRTGLPVDTICGRLFLFWRWVERHGALSDQADLSDPDAKMGVIRGARWSTLSRMAGGDREFWTEVQEVGWLIVDEGSEAIYIPGFEKRFSARAKKTISNTIRQRNLRQRDRDEADVKRDTSATDARHERDESVTGALPEQNRTENNRTENTKESQAASADATASARTTEAARNRAAVEALPIPDALRSDGFLTAWSEWQVHRRQIKKPLTPLAAKAQLAQFADWGHDRSVQAIRHTIAMGWQGIREPDARAGPAANGSPKPKPPPLDDRPMFR